MFCVSLFGFSTLAFADTYHAVSPGDSLWKISVQYGVTVKQIQELNGMESSLIHPGQSLLVSKGNEQKPASVVPVSRGTNRADEMISYAKSFVGSPYRYGGQSPKGFDCSGYLKYVYRNLGIEMPRTAAEQYNKGKKINENEAKPGDLVAFASRGSINHSGIYLGGGKFISSTSSSGVQITSVYGPYWGDHFYGFSRIIP